MWYSEKLYRTGIEHLNGRQNRLSGNEDEINYEDTCNFTCFNRKELTKRGMATLSENRDVTFDYVILDDNSSDGTREMLKQMRDDGTYQIDLIEETEAISGMAACTRRSNISKIRIWITTTIC